MYFVWVKWTSSQQQSFDIIKSQGRYKWYFLRFQAEIDSYKLIWTGSIRHPFSGNTDEYGLFQVERLPLKTRHAKSIYTEFHARSVTNYDDLMSC